MIKKGTNKDKSNTRSEKRESARRKRRRKFHKYWEAFVVENLSRIRQTSRTLARGDGSLADDLTQGTVLRILHYCPDPAGIRDRFTFLRRVTKNLYVDNLQKPTDNLDDISESLAMPHDLGELFEDYELLKKVVGPELTPKLALMLRMWLQGNTWEQIADALNEPVATTRFRWYQFRNKLRRRVQRKDNSEMARQEQSDDNQSELREETE